MERSISASDSNKSEELQQYFYDEIKTKFTKIEGYKRKSNILFIVAFISLAVSVFIASLPAFIYQIISARILVFMFALFFYVALYFSTKIKSERSAPSENGYIFYHLKNIKKYLSLNDSIKAQNELKSLILYVNNIKETYPDEPFTGRIFKNLSTF